MGIICSQSQIGSLNGSAGIGDTDCENRSFNNNLDYPFIFQKIITQVQNDRVNLSLARIYWAINSEAANSDLANIYIMNHFNTIGVVPEVKNYPDTHKRLIQYIKNGKNMQKEAYFIDNKQLIEENLKNDIVPKISLFFLNATPTQIDPITNQSTYHKINTDILYN